MAATKRRCSKWEVGIDTHTYTTLCIEQTTSMDLQDSTVCVCVCVCVCAQLCLTLCNSVDCSPPGSSVHGILQARTLVWVAFYYSMESF